MNKETILNVLEDLTEQEFATFKFFLNEPGITESFIPIKKYQLETRERTVIVELMVKTYKVQGAIEVTQKILEKIPRNDILQNLLDGTLGPAAPTDDILTQHIDISSYQLKLQSNLMSKFMCVQEGWAKKADEQRLDDIYTELYVTAGGDIHINTQHEVTQIEMVGKLSDAEQPIKPSDLFTTPTGKYKPIRTVLTNGNAGIGKTFLIHKFVLDWAKGRANKEVHLVFPFTFRYLNLLKGKHLCLADLVHKCITEYRDIKKDTLNHIFTTLQSSGDTNFDSSKFKLLFILDGLDESRLKVDATTNKIQDTDLDVTAPYLVEVLLTNLINRSLLPSARLWITTRPAAANQIHSDFVDIMTEVRGFTDSQKEDYFRKKSKDEEQASRIISHVKAFRSLHIMCHIPVFCWITVIVLEDMLKIQGEEMPKTLTEMYIYFLFVQSKLKNNSGDRADLQWNPESSKIIKILAKLAFEQLEKGNVIFYESDLRDSGINIRVADTYSGVFTQIFKKERGLYKKEVFCFIHLSVQEFLAALHVHLTFTNFGINLLTEKTNFLSYLRSKLCKAKLEQAAFYQSAVDKALQNQKGQLDLFLRFLLGLSLQTNQILLGDLSGSEGSSDHNQETINYIKDKIGETLPSERIINLFHCLNELNDSSLVQRVQRSLSSGKLTKARLSPAQWSALGFILLSSEQDLELFNLKKYSASEQVLLRLLPVVTACKKALLSGCNLSERSCEALSSVLSAHSSSLIELDLSNNDLRDSGVNKLSDGLKSPNCRLKILRLSGCLITEIGCSSLALALRSNPSHLQELDLSFNNPGDFGMKQLSAGLEDPEWRLEVLRLDHGGKERLKNGLQRYFCELTVDTNSVHRCIKLYNDKRMITMVAKEQHYPAHPERFKDCPQVLCSNSVTGYCYWEVEWTGLVYISVAYKEISRKGISSDCWFGENDQSWSLLCSDKGYAVLHKNNRVNLTSIPSSSSDPHRVAVYVNYAAGILSFYKFVADKMVQLHTFNTTFSKPLYPGFGFGLWSMMSPGSTVHFCLPVEEPS